jgi:hypothetical protein
VFALPPQLGQHVVADATAQQLDRAYAHSEAQAVRPHGELDRQREREHGDERISLFERRRYRGSGGLGHRTGAGFTRREDRPGDGVHAPVAPAQARVIPGRADVRHAYVDSGQRPPQLDVTPRIVDRVAAQVLGEFAARTSDFDHDHGFAWAVRP